MRFSEHFNITPNHQRDLEFVDIRLDTDNRLFIDPTIMAVSRNQRDLRWHDKIQSFIATVLNFYREGDNASARALFNCSQESNEIYLGYTVGAPQGNGNSEESLDDVFRYAHERRLLEEGLIERVEDLHIFVPKFGPDSLSDLVASLIKQELIQFTVEQCNQHGIELSVELTKPTWNQEGNRWETVTAMLPEDADGNPIVLIPKGVITASYAYDPKNYLSTVIAVNRQEYHRANETDLHNRRLRTEGLVSKKMIYEEEIKGEGLTEKEYLINNTLEDITQIQRFRTNIRTTQRTTNNGRMSDMELEDFLNDSYRE